MKTNKTLDKEQRRFEEKFLEPTGVGGVRNNKFKKGVEPMHVHNFLLQSNKRVMEETIGEVNQILYKRWKNGRGSLSGKQIYEVAEVIKSLKNTK